MENIKKINQLLVMAWSAEYALRLTPLLDDGCSMDVDKSLSWTLPQSYYSALFLVRALLTARGEETGLMSEWEITCRVDTLIEEGVYPSSGEWRNANGLNFLAVLSSLKGSATSKPLQVSPASILNIHRCIVEETGLLADFHERTIQQLLGTAVYFRIIANLPQYLLDSFVGERFRQQARTPQTV